MKVVFLFVWLVCLSYTSHGQNNHAAKLYNSGDTVVYHTVETPPAFPGGVDKLGAYILKHLKITANDLKPDGFSGRFIMQMIIEKDGSVTHVKMLNKANKKMGNKIVNVLNHSPKWQPGLLNGQPVRASYSLPISF
jgi:protein TonB